MATKNLVLFIILLLIPLIASITTIEALKPKVARLQFYMHDIVDGPNRTAVRVASQQPNNSTNTMGSFFGSVSIMDNPLTATHEINSTLIGRAQGMYAISSQEDISMLMTLTYVIVSGPYNGSTFSVIGRNSITNKIREMPIVGGTGMFRLARGYCLAETHSMDAMDAIVRYNVTVLY